MSRLAIDTRAQDSWKELIEKEAQTRMFMKFKNSQAEKDDDEWFDKSAYTKQSSFVKAQLPIIYPPKPVRAKPTDTLLELANRIRDESKSLSEMKTVDPKITDLIYDGLAKEQKGRYQYLKQRKSENPENKYEFPILSSWEYGWRLNDVTKNFKTPANGRSKIVEESFYRRNGVFEFKKN
jgi:hypothetical protein